MDEDLEHRVRQVAFEFLREKLSIFGKTVPRNVLQTGFTFENKRVPLVGPQGIFKPAILDVPLTITSVVDGPYPDAVGLEGLLEYRYRSGGADFHENVRLRNAMAAGIPLIWLDQVQVGEYAPEFPVYVIADRPEDETFVVDVVAAIGLGSVVSEPQRAYAAQVVQRRLHQAQFAANVMRAYDQKCTVCRLQHRELLDAAHILPDKHPRSTPTIPNGLSMCKLHHAAFDQDIIGIHPDLVVHVREDILEEIDGPMLTHGLQGFQGQRLLWIPKRRADQPNPEFLEERFESFRRAG